MDWLVARVREAMEGVPLAGGVEALRDAARGVRDVAAASMSVVCLALAEREAAKRTPRVHAVEEKAAVKRTSPVHASEEKVKRHRQEEGDDAAEKQKQDGKQDVDSDMGLTAAGVGSKRRVKGDGEAEQLPAGLGLAKKTRRVLLSSSGDGGGPGTSPTGGSTPSIKLSPVMQGTWWKARRDGSSVAHNTSSGTSSTVSLQV